MAWTPPEFDGGLPLVRYSVEINDTSQWSYSVFVEVPKNRFTFTSKDGLTPGTLYTVYVQAFNEFEKGEKGQSSVISAYCKYLKTNRTTRFTQINLLQPALKSILNNFCVDILAILTGKTSHMIDEKRGKIR